MELFEPCAKCSGIGVIISTDVIMIERPDWIIECLDCKGHGSLINPEW
jgi:hypothetical protein